MKRHPRIWPTSVLAAAIAAVGAPAMAQSPAPAPAAAPAAEEKYSGLVIDGISLSAQIQGGVIGNPYRPNSGMNFGQTITDRANQFMLNQILLTAAKPIDPENKEFQWGFKLQGMYGADARYTQFMGIFNNALPTSRNTFDIVEANAVMRLPIFSGGLDLKAGLYSTPLGFETIDPATNLFYSHSYTFQFGLPFKHTGMLAVAHVSDMLDIYAGVDTGANTTFGPLGENNSALGGIAGFGLNLMEGKLTVLALTHFGPENASRFLAPLGINANSKWRSYNDILITYKATDALTLVTEFNWVRDAYGYVNKPVNGFGVVQYASYALSDTLTLNARAEVWRDDNNYFVASFAGPADPVRFQQALPLKAAVYGAGGPSTTYGSLTLGVTYKPDVPAPIAGLMIRPEIRWDHAYTGNKPFNTNGGNPASQTKDSFTIGADIVLKF